MTEGKRFARVGYPSDEKKPPEKTGRLPLFGDGRFFLHAQHPESFLF